MDTMIMTATNAAIGILESHSPRNTTIKSRKTPAHNVESRVRPPDFTLMIDWPIMAQPAMPPRTPDARLSIP